ncbi:MAG: AI-2E family transporter [Solirubrobacterales bacterium]|nr:AI-2E family transporter [Solirubrobacterales bacterium]
MQPPISPARATLRTVLVVVVVAVALYLVYLLRQPLLWIGLAVLLAVALSPPVGILARRMPRGAAIAIVYVALLLVPVLLANLLVPPLVGQADALVNNLPGYAREARELLVTNATLRTLDEDYELGAQLERQARELPARLGDAAGVLSGIGLGLASSVFALVTILVLAAFLLGSGGRWIDAVLSLGPRDRADRMRDVLNRIGRAVSGYVAGAFLVATIAGASSYLVLVVLGVPFSAPLAVLMGVFSLVPLVGATIAAVIVGLVTLFTDFPAATIAWAVWAIVYQQIENNVIQPQVQRRAADIHPFVVLVAVLFGSALLGVLGAVVAIPVAASIQIAVREWWTLRRGPSEPVAAPAKAEPTGQDA